MPRQITKVLLLQPNLRWCQWHDFKTSWEIVPYNLCLLAAMIEQDYEVSILDANFNDLTLADLRNHVSSLSPDVVGITMLTSEYREAAHEAAKAVKTAGGDITTILGGVYATTSPMIAMRDESIDYLVRGEGEHILPELLSHLSGRCALPSEGIAYRENGKPVSMPKTCLIEDLNSLPFPALHLIDYSRYTNSVQRVSVDGPARMPVARIRTSRGCPVGCTFCQVEQISGKKLRPRSVQNVIDELKWQKEEYGIKSVLFNDDNLILNKKRAKELFRSMIRENLDLTWNATAVAVFALDEELIALMKESGCVYMDIAVESGNKRILDEIIEKPVNLDYAIKMARRIKEEGIYLAANFIIGFPGETWQEIRNTLKYAEKIAVDYVKIFIATPLKGTRLYDNIVAAGLLEDLSHEVEQEMNWSVSKIKSDEFTSKDLSILRAYEWDRINFTDPEKRTKTAERMKITENELKRLIRKTLDSVG